MNKYSWGAKRDWSNIGEIVRLKSLLGFTLVLVTHDPLEVVELCNSLAVLKDGRGADRGSFDEVAENAKSSLAQALIKQLSETKSMKSVRK